MSQPDTYSGGNRTGKVEHHSARGKLPRNSGNYTRGSQLIVHEFMMWFGSSKIPFIIVLGFFFLIFALGMSAVMRDHEVQMVSMKLYSWMWDFLGLDPYKIVRLTLRGGVIIAAPIDMVPSHPQVVVAWAKMMRCFWGSIFMSCFVGGPFAIWYVGASKERGEKILEERHQRGAMLVDAHILAPMIDAHNRALFEQEAKQKFPDLTANQVIKLPYKVRKDAGIHHPYSLAGVNFPHRTEQSHTMLIGTTGTGKSTAMKAFIKQMRARKHRGVVFDLTGDFVASFYNPETDIILNPMDKRCPSWSVFNDCFDHADLTSAAAALVPIDGGASEPFWIMAARTLFIEACVKLMAEGKATNQMLASRLMMADLKQVHKMLEGTIADPLTAPEAARMAESIRAVFNTNAQALRFLPEDGPRFSIKDWVQSDDERSSILFISSSHNQLIMNRALLTL
jgi:Type IV secretion-system coupling protein DNA-binding domain